MSTQQSAITEVNAATYKVIQLPTKMCAHPGRKPEASVSTSQI